MFLKKAKWEDISVSCVTQEIFKTRLTTINENLIPVTNLLADTEDKTSLWLVVENDTKVCKPRYNWKWVGNQNSWGTKFHACIQGFYVLFVFVVYYWKFCYHIVTYL